MDVRRELLVIADDFGIGPETSHAILDLGRRGRVGGTVLLVNSPHAAEAVAHWRAAGRPLALGWHPNLTLDRPVAPARRVPSLVAETGTFHPIGAFLTRWALGLIRPADVAVELRAQWRRFVELVGAPPALVASHHHVAVLPPVGRLLLRLLGEGPTRPYLRGVAEPWNLGTVLSPRRLGLNLLGRRARAQARAAGFHGADWLIGLGRETDWSDALRAVPGRRVELVCHPGRPDPTLVGRDRLQARRVREYALLASDAFAEASRAAGFALVGQGEGGQTAA